MTLEFIDAKILACVNELSTLEHQAKQLRQQHLSERLKLARSKDDTDAIKAISRIIRKERQRRDWSTTNSAIKGPGMRSVCTIQITEGDTTREYSTKQSLEENGGMQINKRYTQAYSAPICSSSLLDDVGMVGDCPAVQRILRGTYEFPPDTDRYTIYLLKEACKIFQHMTPGEIVEMVTAKDFQDSWKSAREKTSSSHSELHFGLYMASSKSDKLSLLHAAKLTLAAKLGIPLDRWSNGITVLLEKTFGATLIDQLRAICLLEADYNWLMKIIFAKRMMDNAYKKGLIPDEHFTKAGSQASEGALVKVLMNDRTIESCMSPHLSPAVILINATTEEPIPLQPLLFRPLASQRSWLVSC